MEVVVSIADDIVATTTTTSTIIFELNSCLLTQWQQRQGQQQQ